MKFGGNQRPIGKKIMINFNKKKFNKYIKEKIVMPLVENIIDQKKDIYKNTLDPFSALVDCMIRNCSPSNWVKQEEGRQTQKTLQNKVGNLHEYVIDCFDNWINLKTGKVIDVVNKKLLIIAEIKNKYNTTKGNHKKDIYDDLKSEIEKNYNGFTAYYVEILPKNKKRYNEPFTPTDNTKNGQKRPHREDIRIIDGASFYHLVSEEKDFVQHLYTTLLPSALKLAIDEINETREDKLQYPTDISKDPYFKEFIEKAY